MISMCMHLYPYFPQILPWSGFCLFHHGFNSFSLNFIILVHGSFCLSPGTSITGFLFYFFVYFFIPPHSLSSNHLEIPCSSCILTYTHNFFDTYSPIPFYPIFLFSFTISLFFHGILDWLSSFNLYVLIFLYSIGFQLVSS